MTMRGRLLTSSSWLGNRLLHLSSSMSQILTKMASFTGSGPMAGEEASYFFLTVMNLCVLQYYWLDESCCIQAHSNSHVWWSNPPLWQNWGYSRSWQYSTQLSYKGQCVSTILSIVMLHSLLIYIRDAWIVIDLGLLVIPSCYTLRHSRGYEGYVI